MLGLLPSSLFTGAAALQVTRDRLESLSSAVAGEVRAVQLLKVMVQLIGCFAVMWRETLVNQRLTPVLARLHRLVVATRTPWLGMQVAFQNAAKVSKADSVRLDRMRMPVNKMMLKIFLRFENLVAV